MAGAKRGPKTSTGKQKSAQNAITHGLRSTKLTSTHEQENYGTFLNELVDFYKPEGPIEHLQLERIATCKAKIQSLYELEQAKLELLAKEVRSNEKKHVDKLTHLDPIVRGMLKELLLLKFLVLPRRLHIDQLTVFVEEMNSLSQELHSDDDIKEFLPKLAIYLQSIESAKETLHERLFSLSNEIQNVIDRGENYSESLKLVFADKFKVKKKEKTPEELSHEKEIDDYMEATRQQYQKKLKVGTKSREVEFPAKKKLDATFNPFQDLHHAYLKTYQYIDGLREEIELNERALSLPVEEADLLMRYQTSWERRLSTLIGEFMQLQRVRLLSNS